MNDATPSSFIRACIVALAASPLIACVVEHDYVPRVHAGDADRGEAALASLECGACHVIPGIAGARGQTGPSLAAYSRRSYVAGKFPNEPETLVRFILDPPALAPLTAMPAVEMSDQDARDIAAYLYELE
jgi:cytochrome c1